MAEQSRANLVATTLVVVGLLLVGFIAYVLWRTPASTLARLDSISIKIFLVLVFSVLIVVAGLILFEFLYDPPIRRFCRNTGRMILGAGIFAAGAPIAVKSAQVDLFNEIEGVPQLNVELMEVASKSLDVFPTMVIGWIVCLIVYFLCDVFGLERH